MSNKKEYVLVELLCEQYQISTSFLEEAQHCGLLHFERIEEQQYLHYDEIEGLEKIIDYNQNLGVNVAGIEVIFNLLDKIEHLQHELNSSRKQIAIWQER